MTAFASQATTEASFKASFSREALGSACASVAPTFPLDRFIAVNPYWGYVSQPVSIAAEKLKRLSGTKLLMPHSWFKERWVKGQLTHQHLEHALKQSGSSVTLNELLSVLESENTKTDARVLLITHLADRGRDIGHQGAWAQFVTHSVSQLCASYFDGGQASWTAKRPSSLYQAWKQFARVDKSAALLMHCDLRDEVSTLPDTHEELLGLALTELELPPEKVESYLSALLLDINGWASWCAYRRFQAGLLGKTDDAIEHLAAVRLAWELLLFRNGGGRVPSELAHDWNQARQQLPVESETAIPSELAAKEWILQRAVELSFQESLVENLKNARATPRLKTPSAQVVFCIDVRSEPFRRGLEAASARVQTLGFAGFFGLPIEYAPLGTELVQAQLPGLLAARLRVTDTVTSPRSESGLRERRLSRLGLTQSWLGFQRASNSGFAFVEALGLGYAWKLARDSFGLGAPTPLHEAGLKADEVAELRPRLVSNVAGGTLDLKTRVELVHNILKAATLADGLARLVVFAGHGSTTSNNPHAAGLDCGACSGQSGAVNARVLAALLNDPDVRNGLRERNLFIPETTHFLGGMHNTTTDELELFDLDQVPPSHQADVAELEAALLEAGRRTRAERAPTLGLKGDDKALLHSVLRRSRDWSEVRPEWGLVDNAAFIVAPRERTSSFSLNGRVFLHDYRFEQDAGFGILELIMTAPMVVTHWINMQYYASTVDNQRYGSGNKVLHNVVGGNLGVFEGNGGDLRIGLPLQSVHDGERFRHTPLRLSVFIEAPRAAIEGVIAKHSLVRQLVENEWMHLFRLDEATVEQRRGTEWHEV
ncbi:MAG: DUF2309 domain-containing protein [Polyangiaceae bacterium]|nr:DUF2309 domain-containing protein [Polyangiaceae bacterium]